MNIIKIFNTCCFITKDNDVTLVVGDQKRPICDVLNRIIARLWSVRYTRGKGIFQHCDTYQKRTGYTAYITHDTYQFNI